MYISQCIYLYRNNHIRRKLLAKKRFQSRTYITLQFLAFLGMLDLRTVCHTGELQSINLLSVFFLDEIKSGYTKVAVTFTFPQNSVFSKSI